MDPDEFLLETEDSMQKAADHVAHEMSGVRTGKASPSLVENLSVYVQSYGTTMPLRQIALISTPEARLLTIQAHDPSAVSDIERAIKESKIGITPISDGRLIRLPIPELTEERRRDMVKLIKDMAETGRIRVRAARKDGMDALKKALKDKALTEDSFHDLENEVQKLTDKFVKLIDDHFAAKEKDLMKV